MKKSEKKIIAFCETLNFLCNELDAMSMHRLTVLFHVLSNKNGITKMDLHRKTGLSQASISKNVNMLMSAGFVSVTIDLENTMQHLVVLAEEGIKLKSKLFQD